MQFHSIYILYLYLYNTIYNNDLENVNDRCLVWKQLTDITDGYGKSFALPPSGWQEMKIYSTFANGTMCALEISINNLIVVDTVQYMGKTIMGGASNYDTFIIAFSSSGVTIHDMIANGIRTTGRVNVIYR